MREYRINEIFRSVQGEGHHAGKPAVFVRFAGCNLTCPWCDTDHEVKHRMSAAQIETEVGMLARNGDHVVFTGGEPLLQVDKPLLLSLRQHVTAVETNGTVLLPGLIDWLTVSPKAGREIVLTNANEVKVVLDGTIDPAEVRAKVKAAHYFIQPCSQDYEPAVNYVMENEGWKLSLQLQKVLGVR